MRAVTPAFLRTILGSHAMVASAIVCSEFQTGTTPTGVKIDIIDGDVKLDGTAEIRSTLDLTTNGRWPVFANDPLTPYGNEIYVKRGVKYSDGLIETVGLGYFRIQAPEQDRAPDGPIKIEARDRMAGIVDGRLLAPVQFLPGATLGFVFNTLVKQVYPSAVIEWDDASDTNVLARSAIADEDRYAFLDKIVRSLGKVWYWDHRGALVIKAVPNPAQPVVEVAAGEGGVLLKLSRSLTRQGVYNAVVATSDAIDATAPVRGVAIDNNPLSPTYFHGRFGPVPRFFASSFLTTQAQAQVAAEAMLRRNLGLPYSVDFTAVPNPALEPWDPIRTRVGRDGPAETHVLETLSIPLVAGVPLTGATREQTVVLIGTA